MENKERKIRYKLKNKNTGEIDYLYYTLSELEDLTCHPVNQKDWVILAREWEVGRVDKSNKPIYEGDYVKVTMPFDTEFCSKGVVLEDEIAFYNGRYYIKGYASELYIDQFLTIEIIEERRLEGVK